MSRKFKFIMAILAIIWLILAPSIILGYFSDEPESGEVTYQLDWEWGDAMPTDEGWQVINDLGYTVNVTQGYLVSYSSTLIECEHSHGIFDWLFGMTAPSVAYAGHGEDDIDPAMLDTPHVESLHQPQTLMTGTVIVPEPSYCQGHYLVARGSSDTVGLPEDIEMYGTSLYIAGTYQANGSDEVMNFAVETSLANGDIIDLMSETGDFIHAEISDETIEITITRQLDSLFDGIDFSTMPDDDIARSVLWALMDNTRLIVTGGAIH